MALGALVAAYRTYEVAKKAPAALALTRAARAGDVAGTGQALYGVIGTEAVLSSLARLAVKIAFRSGRVDADAASEMVDLMRSRVPRDTGRLFNGISAHVEGASQVVEASAAREVAGHESADYARFVEFGTASGERGSRRTYVADEGFFDADGFGDGRFRGRRRERTRKVKRSHPGTPPQPYFFNSAREVLERRGVSMQSLLDEAAAEFNQAA